MSSADSHGHLTSKDSSVDSPVLVIDLDETLLSINSFHVWAKYFLFDKFEKLDFIKQYVVKVQAGKIFAERKILGRSHLQTKFALHKLWLEIDDQKALDKVMARLEEKIRPNMRGVLELIEQKKIDAVLATAASSVYAEPFARTIGFSNVIATQLGGKENRAEEKSKNILEFLEKQGWQNRKKIFFTDHPEDTPFIMNCDKLMWFGKTEEIAKLKQLRTDLGIVECQNLNKETTLKSCL